LSQQRGVDLRFNTPGEPVVIFTDPSMAQQALISLCSYAIRQAGEGFFSLAAEQIDGAASITLRHTFAGDTDQPVVQPATDELIRRLGWAIEVHYPTPDERMIALNLASSQLTVLVIDDNQGLVDLVGRYLSSFPCQVAAANSGE
jgi:hypothetical protein